VSFPPHPGRLWTSFDEVAHLYDRTRPRYPPQLFADVADLAGLRPGSRVLEIGCGTGQASESLARAGYDVVALDLGASMVALARENLAAFANVRVEHATFEDWSVPGEPFDLVFSATAWHWVDPAVRVGRARAALRPGGALAVVHTHHVAGAGDAFLADVQACYERWMPGTSPGQRLPTPDEVPPDAEPLPGFAAPHFRRHAWDATYDTRTYLDLISTYSSHRALEPEAHDALLACVAETLDTRHGGRFTKRYLAELRVAVRDR